MNCEQSKFELTQFLAPFARAVEADIELWIADDSVPEELANGMRYCVEGGKRFRPALVCLSAAAAGAPENDELVRRAAASVELVHAYSLIHDDLPCMDDDETRRGRPTAHVRYGEAMAILIGDALLTRAMGLLAESADPRAAGLVAELCLGAGPSGMVAGQVADMDLCSIADGMEGIEYIHRRKTAALIRAAARMGAVAAGAGRKLIDMLGNYAEKLGMAFQVFDDLLDESDSEKRSCLAQLGPDEARSLGRRLTDEAESIIQPLGDEASGLKKLAEMLVNRGY
jgi:geranylgeranyl pyrophosphate synthase